jgi:hypothetical protein
MAKKSTSRRGKKALKIRDLSVRPMRGGAVMGGIRKTQPSSKK